MARASGGGAVSEGMVVLTATGAVVLGLGGLVVWQALAPGEAPPAADDRVAQLEQRLSEADAQIAELTEQVRTVRADRETAEVRAEEAEARRLELQAQAELDEEEARGVFAELVKENEALRQEVERLTVSGVRPAGPAHGNAGEAAGGVSGSGGAGWDEELPEGLDPTEVAARLLHDVRVVDVNEGLDYVVLDAGQIHGVRPGMRFVLMDGDAALGRLRAIDVREELTGAAIETLTTDHFPAPGDRAVLRSGGE